MEEKRKQFQRTEDGHLILMTPEERMLLIRDLTARIDYGVICMIERVDDFGPMHRCEKLTGFCNEERGYFYFDFNYGLAVNFAEKVRPYLRSLEQLSEEEKECRMKLIKDIKHGANIDKLEEFYLSHHIDYHGLIPKGLAAEALEGMYEIKQESEIPERPTSIEF